MTVAEWVCQRHELPTADVDVMLREIEAEHHPG